MLSLAAALLSLSGAEVTTHKSVHLAWKDAKRGTVVAFMSARCPCSAAHEKALSELYSEYSKKGFHFIGVHSNFNENVAETESHFMQSKLPFQVLQDDRTQIANAFGALKTPHVFVVSPTGEVLFAGGVDDSRSAEAPKKKYLAQALEAISQGKNPEIKEAKTLGCVIARP